MQEIAQTTFYTLPAISITDNAKCKECGVKAKSKAAKKRKKNSKQKRRNHCKQYGGGSICTTDDALGARSAVAIKAKPTATNSKNSKKATKQKATKFKATKKAKQSGSKTK